jgi:hypothetical protein
MNRSTLGSIRPMIVPPATSICGETMRTETTKCIRCTTAKAPEPLGLCTTCVVQTRIELASGIRRLGEYLAAWAAFDDWCRSRGAGPATG